MMTTHVFQIVLKRQKTAQNYWKVIKINKAVQNNNNDEKTFGWKLLKLYVFKVSAEIFRPSLIPPPPPRLRIPQSNSTHEL